MTLAAAGKDMRTAQVRNLDDVLKVSAKLSELRSQVKRVRFQLETPSTAADYIEVNAGTVICAEADGCEKLGEVLGDIRRKVTNAGAA